MSTVTLQEAQLNLAHLIDGLKPGEEIIITRDQLPIARLVGEEAGSRNPRKFGIAKDKILYMAEDFDAPLDDFKEYTE